ncbi:LysR substrate-binding domain-containing protein [Salaquimonas pukyongi]|uniref:LysR substrate-binding domain-containing protein n=1 Tax=Salaquimonas pukyongi TaxID=2712698 RepID=UPI00096B9B59|nr:LysR substrate-binding domain-containing protein [Salaquimonas pukyongi]
MSRRTIPTSASLIAFEAAARCGSFTRAARELNLTQGAISRQIRVLEEQSGQQLFVRERQRVRLSPAGEAYLEAVSPLLEALEIATLKLQSWRDLAGSLTVATYPTLCARWLSPHLFAFTDAFPGIDLATRTFLDNTAMEDAKADILIVQGDPPWPGMQADFLMQEKIGPVCTPQLAGRHGSFKALMAGAPLLRNATRPLSWELWLRDAGHSTEEIRPGRELVLPQFEMIVEAVRAGRGVGILPHQLVAEELASGSLAFAHDHVMTCGAGYYLLSPLRDRRDPRIEAFREFLLSRAVSEN